MSFAVVHMQKFKSSAVKGIQFHNQRERESKTNLDIDKTKSHLNYDIHNQNQINYNQRVKEIIKNNVITDRAIRKDAVVMCNLVVTSNKAFFDVMTKSEQEKFFNEAYNFFTSRYGKELIVACPVHLDERTPHMHLSIVPVAPDNKLSAKRFFDRNELRSLQDDFPKYIQSHGFNLERGIDSEGKNKHIQSQKFKAMELENKIDELTELRDAIKTDLNSIRESLNKAEDIKVEFDKIDSIEGKYGFLNKNKITIATNDFERLKDISKRQQVLEDKIEFLKNQNNDMQKDINKFYKFEEKSRNQVNGLNKELKSYKREFKYISKYLKQTNQIDEIKNFIENQKNVEKQMRINKQKCFEFER